MKSPLRPLSLLILFLLPALWAGAQTEALTPRVTGSLEANGNFFLRDSLIGAANIPQYDRQLFGADAWLNLAYSNWGFDFGLRFDLFNNSNLLNPTDSYTAQGIGMWFVRKQIQRLNIQAGYIYDQVGSGIIFRSFEERPLLIDNALVGLRLAYDLGENWRVKAFTGRQKQQFDTYDPIIKGINLEGFVQPDSAARWSLAPGVGVVNRTLDDATMNSLVATLSTYPAEDIFVPKYNAYAFTAYNTLSAGILSWYVEAAYKTPEAMNDPRGILIRDSVTSIGDKFFSAPGSVLYTSLGLAPGKWGITLEAKRTENFAWRTRPQAQLNRGLIGFLPPLSRVNTYRLTSRYLAATQELGELAWQADLRYAPDRKWNFNVNYAYIDDLERVKLYRELYTEATYKHQRLWTLTAGVQWQNYNQARYEVKPEAPIVETIIPFAEFLYSLDRRRSLRLEAQYMRTGYDEKADARQDYGDWLFGLVEVNLAPHWTLTLSDMYNIAPGKNAPADGNGGKQGLHYPRFDVYYTMGSNRFSLSYIKQVEGVVCTGGICRLEPAFSGVRMTVNSVF